MNYKDIVDLLPYQIAGCPNFVAEKAIKDAVLSFCKRSDAYRLTLEPGRTVAGLYEYEVELPKNTNINTVHSVIHGDKTIDPDTEQGANKVNPQWRTLQNVPTHYIRPNNKTLYLVPTPNKSGQQVVIHASLKPSLTATSISTDFVEDHIDAIVAGAMANLFNAHEMPWANPQRASKHEAEFGAHIREAAIKADGRNGPTRRTVAYGGL